MKLALLSFPAIVSVALLGSAAAPIIYCLVIGAIAYAVIH